MLTLALAATLFSAAPQKQLIIVLPFKANGASQAELAIAREAVLAQLNASEDFSAEASEMRDVKAGMKGARGALSGALMKLGKTWSLNLNLSDIKDTAIVGSAKALCDSDTKLAASGKEAATQILQKAKAAFPPK